MGGVDALAPSVESREARTTGFMAVRMFSIVLWQLLLCPTVGWSHVRYRNVAIRHRDVSVKAAVANRDISFPDLTDRSLLKPEWRQPPSAHTLRSWALNSETPSSYSFLPMFEGNVWDNDPDAQLLSFLPGRGRDLPPNTKAMLKRVARRYIHADTKGDPPVCTKEIIDAIDSEYKAYSLPVVIANQTFSVRNTGNATQRDIAKIVSFAALFRVPEEIATLLFGEDEESPYAEAKECFQQVGWEGVRFARGLTIRLRRHLVSSFRERFLPISRAWLANSKAAARLVNEAKTVRAPTRQLISKEDFLASVDQELGATKAKSPRQLLQDALLFFPRQRKTMKKIRKAFRMKAIMKHGRTAVFTYVVLMSCWGTFGLLVAWLRLQAPIQFSAYNGYIFSSIRRIGIALSRLGRKSRFLRIVLAGALVPVGERALQSAEDRFGVSTNEAIGIMGLAMLALTTAVWTILVFIDANMSRVVCYRS